MTASRTRQLTTAALLAALLAASAYVAIPLQPVPVTFQTFVVVLAALLLEPGWAFAAVGGYILLGAAGVPVFAGARGGLGVLVGPTGGYLFGFLAAAVLGAVGRRVLRRVPAVAADAAVAAVAIGVVYLLGWLQLAAVMHLPLAKAAVAGVLPFLPLDAAKGVAAVVVAGALRRAGVVAGHGRAAEPSPAAAR
jgi:biotin transport system substrate-specific component